MHPLHQLQISSATHSVENYVDYKYDSTLGYPGNKPISRCCIYRVKSDVLHDNGADTSVFAILWIVKNIKGPHLYQLDTAAACYPDNKKIRIYGTTPQLKFGRVLL